MDHVYLDSVVARYLLKLLVTLTITEICWGVVNLALLTIPPRSLGQQIDNHYTEHFVE